MDIDRSFLNAGITNMGINVYTWLNRALASMLVSIDPGHAHFVEEQCTYAVELDKSLCGCVESADLWHANLSTILT
jgi:hypothetical protein